MATKAELQAELDTLGIEYASSANKDELIELLHAALTAPAQAAPEGTQGEPGTAEVLGSKAPPTTSRRERREALPELPEQLVRAREARRRRYELVDGQLTFRAPPSALRAGQAGTEDED